MGAERRKQRECTHVQAQTDSQTQELTSERTSTAATNFHRLAAAHLQHTTQHTAQHTAQPAARYNQHQNSTHSAILLESVFGSVFAASISVTAWNGVGGALGPSAAMCFASSSVRASSCILITPTSAHVDHQTSRALQGSHTLLLSRQVCVDLTKKLPASAVTWSQLSLSLVWF